jgi:hypothetical protein
VKELHDPKICTFVEPSAGEGAIFMLLPAQHRVGVEIDEKLARRFPDYNYVVRFVCITIPLLILVCRAGGRLFEPKSA